MQRLTAGGMIGEVCQAIEMGTDAVDIGRTIHSHPTLGETIGMAAQVAIRHLHRLADEKMTGAARRPTSTETKENQ